MSALQNRSTMTQSEIDDAMMEYVAKVEKERDTIMGAVENLLKVKGRYHSEQAYKSLEETYNRMKGAA